MHVDPTFYAMDQRSCKANIKTEPGLVFITQLGPPNVKDKAVQTQIRKHVMRDIGKSRRKGKKNIQLDLEFPENLHDENFSLVHRSKAENTTKRPTKSRSTPADEYVKTRQLCLNRAGIQIRGWQPQTQRSDSQSHASDSIDRLWTGRADPFIRYPFDLDQRTREHVDQAFDDRYINIGPFRDACLPVGMTDQAAFLQILANALINVSCGRAQSHNNHIEPYEAMMYHAKAVKLVNDRIREPEYVISDGFISAIIGFACYHSCTGAATSKGSQNARQIHMDGIDQVLLLRGGIDTLNSNIYIRTLLGWSDVEGACIEDSQPRYPCAQFLPPPSSMPQAPLSTQASTIVTMWSERLPMQSHIIPILLDLRHFMSFLQNEAARTRRKVFSNGEFATAYLFPLMHRLCCLASPVEFSQELDNKNDVGGDNLKSAMLQIFRLSLVLSLAEFRRLFGINGIVSALQTCKLRSYLENVPRSSWVGLEILHMWCLVMGGIESSGELRDWYASQVRQVGKSGGLEGYQEVLKDIREVLWFEDIHGPMVKEFWDGNDEIRFVGLPVSFGKETGEWKYGGHRHRKEEKTEKCFEVEVEDVGWGSLDIERAA